MACGCMRCMQLQAALLLSPKIDADDRTERQTERQRDKHISLTGPHWVPPDPSVGIILISWINADRRWTPTLEINRNTKIGKGLRMTGQTDGRTDRRTYYTATQGTWSCGLRLHVLHTITVRAFIITKKRCGRQDRETDRKKDRETERWTDRHIISTRPHWGPPEPNGSIIFIFLINIFLRWTPHTVN